MAGNSRDSVAPKRPNPIPNSKPFPKGVSGNPSGRPKDVLTQALRQKLTPEMAQTLADQLLAMAQGGDMRAMVEVWDRVEGKAIARQEQGEPGAFAASLDKLREMPDDALENVVKLADQRKAS